MKRLIISFATAASLSCAHHPEVDAHAQQEQDYATAPAASVGAADAALNPVQREMRLLLTAVQEAMAGVAAGDVRAVPGSFHRLHVAKGGDAAAFEAVDVAATGNTLGDVVRDCHACHSQFR